MKQIIESFTAILFISLFAFASIAIITAVSDTVVAKDYKANIISEIENSNFNDEVINACVSQAQSSGYELQVTKTTYDPNNDINTAEIVLSYKYEIPLFGISVTKTTRGIAR